MKIIRLKLELLNELLNSEEYKQIEKAYTYIDLKAENLYWGFNGGVVICGYLYLAYCWVW